jgi:hypothetical protein
MVPQSWLMAENLLGCQWGTSGGQSDVIISLYEEVLSKNKIPAHD